MDGLAKLLNALEARHSEFFAKSWDSLSADDAKRFTQIERDIIEVRAALGNPIRSQMPDLGALLRRLELKMSELEEGSVGSASVTRSDAAIHEARPN